MPRNTSISLGKHFEGFIKRQVASGRYGTTSEVVRAGLRLLEDDAAQLKALRSAIDEGEESGLVEDYDVAAVLKDARKRR